MNTNKKVMHGFILMLAWLFIVALEVIVLIPRYCVRVVDYLHELVVLYNIYVTGK